jgi:hypothetical protein
MATLPRTRPGEQDHRCAGGGQQFHPGVHQGGEFVGIAPVEDQVIASGIESDQIRLQD